jgi:hypothetical protein
MVLAPAMLLYRFMVEEQGRLSMTIHDMRDRRNMRDRRDLLSVLSFIFDLNSIGIVIEFSGFKSNVTHAFLRCVCGKL